MGISVLIFMNWNILDKSIPFSMPLPLSFSKIDLITCASVNCSELDQ